MFQDYEMILVGIGEEFDNASEALDAYNKLAEILEGKNYFVVSLCMDDVIYNSNLKEDKIVTPLGGKRMKQCPDGCNNELFSIEETKCPHCGRELVFNNIQAENYVEEGYLPMWEKHKKWLTGTLNKKLLVLELGCNMKFPQIIRFPFERISFFNEKSHFIRVNEKFPQLTTETAARGESINANSVQWVKMLSL